LSSSVDGGEGAHGVKVASGGGVSLAGGIALHSFVAPLTIGVSVAGGWILVKSGAVKVAASWLHGAHGVGLALAWTGDGAALALALAGCSKVGEPPAIAEAVASGHISSLEFATLRAFSATQFAHTLIGAGSWATCVNHDALASSHAHTCGGIVHATHGSVTSCRCLVLELALALAAFKGINEASRIGLTPGFRQLRLTLGPAARCVDIPITALIGDTARLGLVLTALGGTLTEHVELTIRSFGAVANVLAH